MGQRDTSQEPGRPAYSPDSRSERRPKAWERLGVVKEDRSTNNRVSRHSPSNEAKWRLVAILRLGLSSSVLVSSKGGAASEA